LVKKKLNTDLASFVDDCIEALRCKETTREFYGHTRRNLIEFFGGEKSLREITPVDAEGFRAFLCAKTTKGKPMSPNTVARRCSVAKQWFGRAVRLKLIDENPFAVLKGLTVRGNADRQHFVTEEVALKVLAACPDAQWRLIFGLCRWGGLRCPSELAVLRWCDVLEHRLIVHAEKTKHHEGNGIRAVPLFPELRPLLDEVRRETGEEYYVFSRGRVENKSNLRTQMQRIIAAAGATAWPKLFQNLRSTRQTELVNGGWLLHQVCKWMGNSRAVAQEHYLQELDEDFRNAAAGKVARNGSEACQKVRHFEALASAGGTSDCVFVGSFVSL
jgi:integrase